MKLLTHLLWLLLLVVTPSFAMAGVMIAVSKEPDTKTVFIAQEPDEKADPELNVYIVISGEYQKTGSNIPGQLDVEFAKADLAKLKWCSYVGKEMEVTNCTPDKPLQPDGTITVK